MRLLLILFTILIQFNVMAQKASLVVHYDFVEMDSNNTIQDKSGNGFIATLNNSAYLDKMDGFHVLNLGNSDGYLDMGEKLGTLISKLDNFSIATYACIKQTANLNANGNFIWAFSNSNDVAKDKNGCVFFSAKTQGYSISKTYYTEEQKIEIDKPLQKNVWKHIVYTQSDNEAIIYIDGLKVKTNSIDLLLKDLGKTKYNYIGKSPYWGDVSLKGIIADFRIYDKALSVQEIKALSKDLDEMNLAYAEYQKKPQFYKVTSNPLFKHRFTADPAALVHKDTFYIYTGEDTGDGKWYDMPNWTVFSSTDLETWTEYPIPLKTSDFKWARGNNSWASQVIERNGKFYWYVSTDLADESGRGVGVAVSNSPIGPFVDARGTALVTNDMTTKWTGISWDDIDPTVWIDDDGQAYLFWGNTQCYYAKLKENMIELESEIMPVKLPDFTEAPWVHKRGDWYYLSYASGFPEKTSYAMSKSIHGPWEYKGILNEISGNSNTNHQAIVKFYDKWYFVYHNGGVHPNGGSFLRSVCIDYLYYNDDGTIKRIQMTSEGVEKVK